MPFLLLPVVGFATRFIISRTVVKMVSTRLGLGFLGRQAATFGLTRALRRLTTTVQAEASANQIATDVIGAAATLMPLGLRTTVTIVGVPEMIKTFERYYQAVAGNTMLTDINRAVMFQTMRGVVLRTPVDTGTARASWFAERNDGGSPKGGSISEFDGSKAAATAHAMQSLEKVGFGPDGIYWITNNQPYIESLEFGLYGKGPKTRGGFSRQAPQGMVRVTLAEMNAKLSPLMKRIIRIDERLV